MSILSDKEVDTNTSSSFSTNENFPTLSILSTNTQANETAKKLRRKFDLEFKAEVIHWYNANDKNQSACERHFGVNRQTMRAWIGQAETILSSKYTRSRHTVATRRVEKWPLMEKKLYEWILEKRRVNNCVTGTNIFLQARIFHMELYPKQESDFTASKGWFGAFLKRRYLVLRRVTTTGRDLPENMNSLIASFFAECMRVS